MKAYIVQSVEYHGGLPYMGRILYAAFDLVKVRNYAMIFLETTVNGYSFTETEKVQILTDFEKEFDENVPNHGVAESKWIWVDSINIES